MYVHTTFNFDHLVDVIIMVNGTVVHHHDTLLHQKWIELGSLHMSQYAKENFGVMEQTHQMVMKESNKLLTVDRPLKDV